jgi:hypothetical protein
MEWFRSLSPGRRALVVGGLLVLSVAVTAFATRSKRGSAADQALDEAFQKSPQLQRQVVARFAGQVTVDGQPPSDISQGSALFVSLHRNLLNQDGVRPFHTICDSRGHFAFSTYVKEDGIAVGSYIVTFVKLRRTGPRRGAVFGPPDELKNLYNDPDRNAQTPEFSVDVKMPGKTDYHFDLAVERLAPVEAPGPHALTRIQSW